jgi:hypothetical protein
MPSSGWMRMVMTLGWISPQSPARLKIMSSGGCLNWMLISVARLAEALAGADVEGHAGPAPVVDLELEGGVGLGAGFGIDALFLAVAGTACR